MLIFSRAFSWWWWWGRGVFNYEVVPILKEIRRAEREYMNKQPLPQ